MLCSEAMNLLIRLAASSQLSVRAPLRAGADVNSRNQMLGGSSLSLVTSRVDCQVGLRCTLRAGHRMKMN